MLVRTSRKNTLPRPTRLPQPRFRWLSHLCPPKSELKPPTALLHCWRTLKVQERQLSTAEHEHRGEDETATSKSLKEVICTKSSAGKSPVLPPYHLKDVLCKLIPGLRPDFAISTARATHRDGSTQREELSESMSPARERGQSALEEPHLELLVGGKKTKRIVVLATRNPNTLPT